MGGWQTGGSVYDITDKKVYQRKIEQQAYTDFLTGLYNRMCCERDLARHIDEAKKDGDKGALLYLDLDDFKHINDGLGHQYGDVLLKAISHSLQNIDGIKTTCYRMGGDEFVILVPPESYQRFNLILEEIKEIFNKPWFLKDADYYCTMSMGVVNFPEDGDSVQNLIKKADIAMYEAKKSGKNRVAYYSDKINSSSNKRLDMEKNMRDATVDGYKEFEVYYQPIIDIQRKGLPCTGAEALIRWNSNELGFISPTDFIPLAEYLGLINPIGNYVLREACKACKNWNDNGYPDYKVNVNLSVVQLLQPDIVDIVKSTIEETGILPKNLTLEVTESLAINDMERMKEILGNIRKLGVRIALDDFGTGYSSLNHIREIPLDVIKVDQSFVIDLAEDNYSQSFIKMISELAGSIGVSICVEGIETKEQYKVLEGMKVQLIQGYYFDRPMKRDAFEEKYAEKLVEKLVDISR
ncbi:MAG: EAL domain-containing protein [Lachnospiraceae bacterium]|nr:EAL domain-containing protein [Lachnospiraceae bacterium]